MQAIGTKAKWSSGQNILKYDEDESNRIQITVCCTLHEHLPWFSQGDTCTPFSILKLWIEPNPLPQGQSCGSGLVGLHIPALKATLIGSGMGT